MKQKKINIVPVTFPKANEWVRLLHRHHAPLPGGFAWFCCAAIADGKIVGVAIAGRPTNRNNDDGQTVEVLRIATDGTSNACSALLGCCARAAKSIGAYRIITYTLETESGISLRAAGWNKEKDSIKSWWLHDGVRTAAVKRDHHNIGKVRWGLKFREPIEMVSGDLCIGAVQPSNGSGQCTLFSLDDVAEPSSTG